MVERWKGGTVERKSKRRVGDRCAVRRLRSTVPPFHPSTVPPFHQSDFVINDPSCLASILSDVNLKVRKKPRSLRLEQTEERDRHPSDLELRALAAPQLEHRPPRSRVSRHDDFRLRCVRKDSPRRLARHFPPVNFVRDPAVALHQ